jgi:hypothetical protein
MGRHAGRVDSPERAVTMQGVTGSAMWWRYLCELAFQPRPKIQAAEKTLLAPAVHSAGPGATCVTFRPDNPPIGSGLEKLRVSSRRLYRER